MTRKRQQGPDCGYQPGDVWSFRTSPATEFSPKETGRYAALEVLGVRDETLYYVVLVGVFNCHPNLEEASRLGWLKNSRFSYRGDPACHGAYLGWEPNLEDFRYVGSVQLSIEDTALVAACRSFGPLSGASHDAEGEWRWRYVRAAYTEEVERSRKARDARLAAERERCQKRLKSLTWGQLLQEQPFSRWNQHPPFPSPDFVAAARDRIRAAILDLQGLGPKPKKGQVRAVLKDCAEWLNARDQEFGHVIETEEREDIWAVLEELAYVAGQQSVSHEIEEWRTW